MNYRKSIFILILLILFPSISSAVNYHYIAVDAVTTAPGCDPVLCANNGGTCLNGVCVPNPTPTPTPTPTPNTKPTPTPTPTTMPSSGCGGAFGSGDGTTCITISGAYGTCVNGQCVADLTPTPTPTPTAVPTPTPTPKPTPTPTPTPAQTCDDISCLFIGGTCINGVCVKPVGSGPGVINITVDANQIIDLMVNSTNTRGYVPMYQWFLFTATMGGNSIPVYVLSNSGLFELIQVLSNISAYTFNFDQSGVTSLGQFAMADLGLKSGDTFVYAYAYMNASNQIFVDNVVIITVQ